MSFSVIMIMIVIIIIIIIILIIIIIIKGTGVGQVGPQPTLGTTLPTRVWGDTFGKCL